MGSGAGDASHNCYATFNRWNDEPNVNVNRNENDWNDNWSFAGVPKLSSFLTPRLCGVEFQELSLPSAQHPPDFIDRSRKRGIFLVVERLTFPEDEQQQFQSVEFPYRHAQVR